MPELPEVETIRQDLRHKILNKKIVQVKVYKKTSVGGQSTKFIQALTGNSFRDIDRRGKLMIFRLKHGAQSLLVHLKMTGQLIYRRLVAGSRLYGGDHRLVAGSRLYGGDEREKKGGVEIVAGGHKLSESDIECLPNKHTRIAFAFQDGGELFFNDLRLFGYMKLATAQDVERALKKFGPEPIETPPPARNASRSDSGGSPSPLRRGGKSRPPSIAMEGAGGGFTFAYFSLLFKKRQNTNLKALLLNQELIAGLGNIYVDEVCFAAGVRPNRRVGAVTKLEQKKLFLAIPKILRAALKHRGTTFRNFLDSSGKKGNYTDFLNVYDRDGEKCKKCEEIIKKIKIAGRGTHFCPRCQR
ncbi:MAG: DNA-formamidopyrimidine glycosylase family protein [Candidatus Magasanikbacteria bacterium]|nr:DNA-formamidopyrimidine glycosylase family protein [Candidatus Magasanikbacteria bacterium]